MRHTASFASTLATTLGAALILGASLPAHAGASGASIGYTCMGCHGDMGVSQGAIPSLAGRSASETTKALNAFKDGSRPSTIMNRIAKGYSADEIEAVANYFAGLPAK